MQILDIDEIAYSWHVHDYETRTLMSRKLFGGIVQTQSRTQQHEICQTNNREVIPPQKAAANRYVKFMSKSSNAVSICACV